MNHDPTPEASALLDESEERYRTLIENASDLIQSVRPDGSFEFVNKAWFDKLGYSRDEMERMHIWDIIHPDSLETCMAHFQAAVQGEPIDHVTAVFVAKDGTAIPVEGDARLRMLDGQVIATHSFFRDVSERLRAEELQKRNEQLQREQLARYLEKMAALGTLSAGLSHELNNPAAAAQRSAQLLEESIARRDAAERSLAEFKLERDQWQSISDLIDRCARPKPEPGERSLLEISHREEAVEDWLTEAGVEQSWLMAPVLVEGGIDPGDLQSLAAVLPSGAMPPAIGWIGETLGIQTHSRVIASSTRRISELIAAVKSYSFRDQAVEQTVDIHAGLEDTLTILAYRLRGLTIVRDYDRTLPKIVTRGSSLNQVWTNMLDNAADATGGEGTVEIRTFGRDDAIVVEIIDNGAGIPEDVRTRIFEPFYTTKPQGHGTGLGLDIAWRIVTDDHHGEIEVESEPGRTVFRVILPVSS